MHGHRCLMMSVLVGHWCGLVINGLRVSVMAHGVGGVHGRVLGVASSVAKAWSAWMLIWFRSHMVRFRLGTLDLLIRELIAHSCKLNLKLVSVEIYSLT
jgi:hypothetical protein